MIKKYIYCLSLVHLHSLPKYPVKGFWPTKGYVKLRTLCVCKLYAASAV